MNVVQPATEGNLCVSDDKHVVRPYQNRARVLFVAPRYRSGPRLRPPSVQGGNGRVQTPVPEARSLRCPLPATPTELDRRGVHRPEARRRRREHWALRHGRYVRMVDALAPKRLGHVWEPHVVRGAGHVAAGNRQGQPQFRTLSGRQKCRNLGSAGKSLPATRTLTAAPLNATLGSEFEHERSDNAQVHFCITSKWVALTAHTAAHATRAPPMHATRPLATCHRRMHLGRAFAAGHLCLPTARRESHQASAAAIVRFGVSITQGLQARTCMAALRRSASAPE